MKRAISFALASMMLASACGQTDISSFAVQSSALSANIGDSVTTGTYELQIQSAQKASSVGDMFFSSRASDGGIYIATRWSYKNISNKPVNAFMRPTLHLRGPDGIIYDPDVEASVAYASQIGVDAKVISDLNPGIRVTDADVFEIAADNFDPSTWVLLVDADRKVEFRFIDNHSNDRGSTSPQASSPAQALPIQTPSASVEPQDQFNDRSIETSVSPSFDCTKANSFAENTVCKSQLLSRLDSALGENYKAMLAANIGDGARRDLRETQRKWIVERNRCTSEYCLIALYRERVDAVCDYPVESGIHPGCKFSSEIE